MYIIRDKDRDIFLNNKEKTIFFVIHFLTVLSKGILRTKPVLS